MMLYRIINFLRNSQTKTIKKYICPDCKMSFNEENLLIKHVEFMHKDNIPEGFTTKQYLFGKRRNKWEQICTICKINKTDWNEKASRYNLVCSDDVCKAEQRRRFLENYKKKHGKDHSISDPETQQKMLQNRSISGVYTFKDGEKRHYTGKREKEFLEHWELDLELTSDTIEDCSIYFTYKYDKKTHSYIPDYYSATYNLIIEIKASDNKHPKYLAIDRETEKLKDEAVIKSKKYNYIKIIDSEFEDLDELIKILKAKPLNNNLKDDDIIIVIPEYKNFTGDFIMPKLNYLNNIKDLQNEHVLNFFNNKNLFKEIKFNLILVKDYIEKDNIDTSIITEDFTVLREELIKDLTDSINLKHSFDKFTLYYTKKYEIYINQLFTSIYFETPDIISCIVLNKKYIDELDILKDNMSRHKYITIFNESNYIMIFNHMRDMVGSYIKNTHGKTIHPKYLPVPGTIDGGKKITLLPEYSNY